MRRSAASYRVCGLSDRITNYNKYVPPPTRGVEPSALYQQSTVRHITGKRLANAIYIYTRNTHHTMAIFLVVVCWRTLGAKGIALWSTHMRTHNNNFAPRKTATHEKARTPKTICLDDHQRAKQKPTNKEYTTREYCKCVYTRYEYDWWINT